MPLDPWWNPATEAQAVDRIHRTVDRIHRTVDRIHRMGQTHKVMGHRLVTRSTIEEKVRAIEEGNALVVDSVLRDDTFTSTSPGGRRRRGSPALTPAPARSAQR